MTSNKITISTKKPGRLIRNARKVQNFIGIAFLNLDGFLEVFISEPFVPDKINGTEWKCVNTRYIISSIDSNLIAGHACPPRGKRHDYFTSALPWTQKGPGVSIGLAGTAPIALDADAKAVPNTVSQYFNQAGVTSLTTGGQGSISYFSTSPSSTNAVLNLQTPISVSAQKGIADNFYANLDESSIFTINSLRTAFQMQKFYERLARGGSRYTEVLRSFFGVVSPDARLQRPEFLGSFTKMVNVNPLPKRSIPSIAYKPYNSSRHYRKVV